MQEQRVSPIDIDTEDFKQAGNRLVEQVAELLQSIKHKSVTTGESPAEIAAVLGNENLPENGMAVRDLFSRATDLLFNHSLYNGHPRFFGYITSSPAPIGALADLLGAAVNPNVGAHILSPMATAIEKQTVRWLAEFIGISPSCGGLLVSGGNMANFTAFLAARTAKAPASLKEKGLASMEKELVFYCGRTTHTWIEKAAVVFGHGTAAIRWIESDADNKLNTFLLQQEIEKDLANNKQPFLVVATAGDVSTGVVDDLSVIAATCKRYDLWFHIDGAYGMPAAALPSLKEQFKGFDLADSIAIDPHKWLYAPLEVGCTLVKDPKHLLDTFSSHPAYYNFDSSGEEPALNYYEYGLQNSRGFRALKVWLALQQVGRQGYIKMIGDDIGLAKLLFTLADEHPELEAVTQNLSITTFRYIPPRYALDDNRELLMNGFNEKLVNVLQTGGEVFVSNAVLAGKYCLRACIVNFRTTENDIHELVNIVLREGRKLDLQFEAEIPTWPS
jgi:glutamate/tyrosine decarboxylase-like PLP-dependent enzyme